MKNYRLTLAIALACATPLVMPAAAIAKTKHATAHAAADMRFLDKADKGNSMELAAASLAADHAGSAATRDYAAHLLVDHRAMHDKIVATASSVGVKLTDHGMDKSMGDAHKNANGMTTAERDAHSAMGSGNMAMPDDPALRALAGRKGADFDRAFAEQMVADHQKVIADCTAASKDMTLSAPVRAFASAGLPTLREHLATAQSLRMAK